MKPSLLLKKMHVDQGRGNKLIQQEMTLKFDRASVSAVEGYGGM